MNLLRCFPLLFLLIVPAEGFWNSFPSFGGIVDSFSSAVCSLSGFVGIDCSVNAPKDGNWGSWGPWTPCNNGQKKRFRKCDNPEPKNGGQQCFPSNGDVSVTTCPVDGVWGKWGPFGHCSKTCGSGIKSRYRYCIGPKNGGQACKGSSAEFLSCNTQECPIDGVWEEWGLFGDCSKSCDGGIKSRHRKCTEPKHGGKKCEGDSTETVSCNTQDCPVELKLDPEIKDYLELILMGLFDIPNVTLDNILEVLGQTYSIPGIDLDDDDAAEQLYDMLLEAELKDLDLNNDGITTVEELQSVLKKLFDNVGLLPPLPPAPEEDSTDTNEKLKQVMYKLFDKNKDQILTAKEVKKALKKLKHSNLDARKLKLNSKSAQQLEDLAMEIAKKIDENGDNKISRKEKQHYKEKQMCSWKGPFCGNDNKEYVDLCVMKNVTGSWKPVCNSRCMKKRVYTLVESSGEIDCKDFANKCEALDRGQKKFTRGTCVEELCRRNIMQPICDTDKVTHNNPCEAAKNTNVIFSSLGACTKES